MLLSYLARQVRLRKPDTLSIKIQFDNGIRDGMPEEIFKNFMHLME